MKKLNISSPIAKQLAALALFERVQALFNLYPAQMAGTIKRLGEEAQVEPSELAQQLLEPTGKIFRGVIANTCRVLSGEALVPVGIYTPYQEGLVKFFELDSLKLAAGIRSKCSNESINPLEATKYLLKSHGEVLLWAFSQTIMILNGEEKGDQV